MCVSDTCDANYFPKKPLKLKELKLCHAEWVEARTYIQRCKQATCEKCMGQHEKRNAAKFLKARKDNLKQLHYDVKKQLNSRGIREKDTILLTTLNSGYYYHFANWACSCDRNHIPVILFQYTYVFVAFFLFIIHLFFAHHFQRKLKKK